MAGLVGKASACASLTRPRQPASQAGQVAGGGAADPGRPDGRVATGGRMGQTCAGGLQAGLPGGRAAGGAGTCERGQERRDGQTHGNAAGQAYGNAWMQGRPAANMRQLELLAPGQNPRLAGARLRTVTGRFLAGERLALFERFWSAYDLPRGKAQAADAWLDLESWDNAFIERVIRAARSEAARREEIRNPWHNPIQAANWLYMRRFEDYPDQPAAKPSRRVEAAPVCSPEEEKLMRARCVALQAQWFNKRRKPMPDWLRGSLAQAGALLGVTLREEAACA